MCIVNTTTGVTVIQKEWLPRLVPSLCTFDKPLDTPAPHYDIAVCIIVIASVH